MLYPLKSNSRGMNNKYIKYIVSKKKKQIQERGLSSEKMVIINELIILVMWIKDPMPEETFSGAC